MGSELATRVVARHGVQGAARLSRLIIERVAFLNETEAIANGQSHEWSAARTVALIQRRCLLATRPD